MNNKMPVISNTLRYMIYLPGVLLLFLPKINLFAVGGQTAGLRIDDFILFSITGLFFIISILAFRKPSTTPEKLFIRLFTIMFIANVLNTVVYNRSSIFYSLRYAEYFTFFVIGVYYAHRCSLPNLARALLYFLTVVMVLQRLGMVGGFSAEGYVPNVSSRVFGLTAGPWEVGPVINLLFAILVFDPNCRLSRWKVLRLFLLTTFLIILTAGRMPILANLAILLRFFYLSSRNKLVFVACILFVMLPLIAGILLLPNNPVVERSSGLFSMRNVAYFVATYQHVDLKKEYDGYAISALNDVSDAKQEDGSWFIRVLKWTYVIKTFVTSPLAWVIGVGPGTWGPALDGGWLRITTEAGLLGLLAFLALFRYIGSLGPAMQACVMALYINMIMLDSYLAYKIMGMMFFAAGYYWHKYGDQPAPALAFARYLARALRSSIIFYTLMAYTIKNRKGIRHLRSNSDMQVTE